jgi:hypothetical protein
MKFNFLIFIFILSTNLLANEAEIIFKKFESKSYSLKTMGIKDLVFDLESELLTRQINEQQVFGKIDQLIFRVYWTLSPERVSVDVIGLPEGFKELKEELKASIFPFVDELITKPLGAKFTGYKFSVNPQTNEVLATDTTGLAPIPSHQLKFDRDDKLVQIVSNKPVGSMILDLHYEKTKSTEGKWIKNQEIVTINENGQAIKISKNFSYKSLNGITLLYGVKLTTEKKSTNKAVEQFKISDNVKFSHFKLNEGLAMKYFLSMPSR